MKRRHPLVVSLFLLLSLALVGGHQSGTVHDLTVLHFNDLHARLLPDSNGRGGFAHLATLLKQERAATGASLTLNAGDLAQGTAMSTAFHGVPIFDLANYLGIDASCLGNHEFDYGWRTIDRFTRAAAFDLVSANVVNASGERLLKNPYVIREAGGLRIAVVGAMLERFNGARSWGPWRAAPVVESLRPVVADARRRADLVLVLGHLERSEVEAILEELPDVAVVVAGHTHEGFDEEIEHDGRIAVNARGFGVEIGRLRLRYDTAAHRIVSHEWAHIPVDAAQYRADPDMRRAVERLESKFSALVDVAIGRASRPIQRAEGRTLIQHAMLERIDADAAYFWPIGVRDVIPEGALLARHIWNVSPLDDRIVTVKISGRDLREVTDPEQAPELSGGAVKIEDGRTYRLVTVDFLAERWIDRGRRLAMIDKHLLLRDLLIDWVKQHGVIP
jgi:2',3'-cyclic-nucleotide 2'-phosphodiesterase (5'-nucleotidase family)